MKVVEVNISDNIVLGELHLDFRTKDGLADTIIIAGENGLGKTTLIKLIMESIYSDYYGSPIKGLGGGCLSVLLRFSLSDSIEILKNMRIDTEKYPNLEYVEIDVVINNDEFRYDLYINTEFILTFHKSDFSSKGYALRSFFKYLLIQNMQSYYNVSDVDGGRFYKTNNEISKEIEMLSGKIIKRDKDLIQELVSEGRFEMIPTFNYSIDLVTKALNTMLKNKELIKDLKEDKLKYIHKNGNDIYLKNMSSGEKCLLLFALTLVYKNDITNNAIIFTEEPENSLHPNWQKKIVGFISTIIDSDKNFNQFIFSTHSPIILESINERNIKYVILKDSDSGLQVSCYEQAPKNNLLSSEAFQYAVQKLNSNDRPTVITEGKTDWKHLKAALKSLILSNEIEDIDIEFIEYEFDLGEVELEKSLQRLALVYQTKPIIGVFDSDSKIGKKYRSIYSFGNNVYAFNLPTPEHRSYHSGISIELLYKDFDLRKMVDGKRLYLSSEFDSVILRLLENKDIICRAPNLITSHYVKKENEKIIDNYVYDIDKKIVCLSKDEFSKCVLEAIYPFDSMDFSGFKEVFTIINKIIKGSYEQHRYEE